jgi:hypothetical protein
VTSAPFLSRSFGEYVLVAQLSEDALGTVYRALYSADERRFVRLRVLQSPELSKDALARAVKANAERVEALAHDTIVPRPQLALAEDIPFLTWDETAGWTLDAMLSRVRALGIRIPAEYALLIAERIAAALEHAHRCIADGLPSDHGLLWPGFVSISHDAAVRVGGFGIAEGVLPTLAAPRLNEEIAPYVAPEARVFAEFGSSADVYSLGAILVELLTGRSPSLDSPSAELRAGDPRSDELAAFLRRCLAPPERRFVDAADAHRSLQQLLTGNPFSLYTANLALFLYKLLNPESQSVATASDLDSTNPVESEKSAPAAKPSSESSAAGTETRRRRKGDLEPSEESAQPAAPQSEPIPRARVAPEAVRVEAAIPAREDVLAPVAVQEHAASLLTDTETPAPAIHAPATKTAETLTSATPGLPSARPWARAAAPLAAAAGVALAAFLVATQIQSMRSATAVSRAAAETSAAPAPEPSVATVAELPHVAPEPAPPASVAAPGPIAHAQASTRPATRSASGQPSASVRKVAPEGRHPVEDLRLRAALARIDADRVNAREAAGDLFGEGRRSEEEGERLLREKDYDAAQLAFTKAARLFQRAQERSWEQRVRQANLSSNSR